MNSDMKGSTLDEERVVIALEEIARWVRFLGWKEAKELVTKNLPTKEDREVYCLSDGRSTREIGKLLGTSHIPVVRRWSDWSAIGLMRESRKYKGRREATFTLEELGLAVPERIKKLRQQPPVQDAVGVTPGAGVAPIPDDVGP